MELPTCHEAFAPTGIGIYLDLYVDDFDQVKSNLARAGVTLEKEWLDLGQRFALIADPNGNLIELIR